MEMKDYSWNFGASVPLGKPKDSMVSRILHTDFKRYLEDLQASEFFNACSYFNLALELQCNGKTAFTIKMDKDKFTLMECGSGKAISLEKFATPACTPDAIIKSLQLFKQMDITDPDRCDSLIQAIHSAI